MPWRKPRNRTSRAGMNTEAGRLSAPALLKTNQPGMVHPPPALTRAGFDIGMLRHQPAGPLPRRICRRARHHASVTRPYRVREERPNQKRHEQKNPGCCSSRGCEDTSFQASSRRPRLVRESGRTGWQPEKLPLPDKRRRARRHVLGSIPPPGPAPLNHGQKRRLKGIGRETSNLMFLIHHVPGFRTDSQSTTHATCPKDPPPRRRSQSAAGLDPPSTRPGRGATMLARHLQTCAQLLELSSQPKPRSPSTADRPPGTARSGAFATA